MVFQGRMEEPQLQFQAVFVLRLESTVNQKLQVLELLFYDRPLRCSVLFSRGPDTVTGKWHQIHYNKYIYIYIYEEHQIILINFE